MTPVGHSLMGASIAVLCLPSRSSRWTRCLGLICFIILANLPDAPLPGWGHDRYWFSHSIIVNGIVMLAAVILCYSWRAGVRWLGGLPVIAGGLLSWLSHFLLDTLYNHGRGLAMFWPFGSWRLALPIAWFSVMNGIPKTLDGRVLRILGIELLAYGTLLVLALFWRCFIFKRIQDKFKSSPPKPSPNA